MLNSEQEQYEIGFRDRWQSFRSRNWFFVETVLPSLLEISQKVLNRPITLNGKTDEVVYLLGKAAMEDYFEIWVLCGNGYGVGGLKILRGLFEKVVTAGYIAKNSELTQDFLDYGVIQARKFYNVAKASGVSLPPEVQAISSDIDATYAELKDRFEGPKGAAPSWNTLDLISMAKKVGLGLDTVTLWAYSRANLSVHATPIDLFHRKRIIGEKKFEFIAEPQSADADMAIRAGIVVLIANLRIQNAYFELGVEPEIARLEKIAEAEVQRLNDKLQTDS